MPIFHSTSVAALLLLLLLALPPICISQVGLAASAEQLSAERHENHVDTHAACPEWFATSRHSSAADNSTQRSDDDGDVVTMTMTTRSGVCTLPTPTRQSKLHADPQYLFSQAAAMTTTSAAAADADVASAATKTSRRGGAAPSAVAVWQLGPRSPAVQAPLHSTMHSYFLNISRAYETETAADTNAADVYGADSSSDDHSIRRDVTRRLRAYAQIYEPRNTIGSHSPHHHKISSSSTAARRDSVGAATPATMKVRAAGREHSTAGKSSDSSLVNQVADYSLTAWSVAQSTVSTVTHVSVAVLDYFNLYDSMRCFTAETAANLRAMAWTRLDVWRSIFYTRHVLVRYPVGVWRADHEEEEEWEGEDEVREVGSFEPAAVAAEQREEGQWRSDGVDNEEDTEEVDDDTRMQGARHNSEGPQRQPHDNHHRNDGSSYAYLPPHVEIASMAETALLRLVSFPPIAQLAESTTPATAGTRKLTLRYTCSLPAVQSARQIVLDDLKAYQQEERLRQRRERRLAEEEEEEGGSSGLSRGTLVTRLVKVVQRLCRRAWESFIDGVSDHATGSHSAGRHVKTAAAAAEASSSSSSSSSLWRASPTVHAARAFVRRVKEELGPHQTSAVSPLPLPLQQVVGNRLLSSVITLTQDEEEETAAQAVADRQAATSPRRARRVAVVRYAMEWSAVLPAGTPMCLALVAVPPESTKAKRSARTSGGAAAASQVEMDGLRLEVHEWLVLDHVWLVLALSALIVLQLERRVAQSALVRHLVTGLTATLLLVAIAAFYIVRKLQNMSLGQLVMLTVLFLAGASTVMNGLCGMLWVYYNMDSFWSTLWSSSSPAGGWRGGGRGYARVSAYGEDGGGAGGDISATAPLDAAVALLQLAGVALLVCTVCGMVLRCLVPAALLDGITRWTVRGMLLVLWCASLRQNMEATLLMLMGYGAVWLCWRRLARSRDGWWGSSAGSGDTAHPPAEATNASSFTFARLFSTPSLRNAKGARVTDNDATSGGHHNNNNTSPHDHDHQESDDDGDDDELPPAARVAQAYVRPLAATDTNRYGASQSREARLRHYDEDGATHTRRALEELAAHLRANPGRYATRLRDPNGLQRWAGGAAESDGDEN